MSENSKKFDHDVMLNVKEILCVFSCIKKIPNLLKASN